MCSIAWLPAFRLPRGQRPAFSGNWQGCARPSPKAQFITRRNAPLDFALVEVPWQDESQTAPLTPSLSAGELLLFDYRLRHRGLANITAAPRPVAYFVFTSPGLSDTRNFPRESVFVVDGATG